MFVLTAIIGVSSILPNNLVLKAIRKVKHYPRLQILSSKSDNGRFITEWDIGNWWLQYYLDLNMPFRDITF